MTLKTLINVHSSYNPVFNIYNNVFVAVNQLIRMISEGSCDAEDWSNGAENSALHHMNKLHFNIQNKIKSYFKL